MGQAFKILWAGVGNIIKNEVLYNVRLHPESIMGKIPTSKQNKLIDEIHVYSFQFLEWKRTYELKNIGLHIQKNSA